MRKLILIFLVFSLLMRLSSEAQTKLSGYLQGQFNKTLYDRTTGNNPWALGIGFQLLVNGNSKFKPIIELTADAYLADDKILRLDDDSTPIGDIGSMINLFGGVSYHPTNSFYLSFAAGPSLVSRDLLMGIKPSIGFYFSQKRISTVKISYINIFNRDKTTREDFGSLSFSLGLKLF